MLLRRPHDAVPDRLAETHPVDDRGLSPAQADGSGRAEVDGAADRPASHRAEAAADESHADESNATVADRATRHTIEAD